MTVITGGEVDAYQRRDPAVVNEDNFNNGTAGWVPLFAGQYPAGLLFLDSQISDPNSRYSLFLQTGTGNKDDADNWGTSTVLKRMARPQLAKKIYMEWKWSFGTEFYAANDPRMVLFALDTCDKDANRRFFQVRYLNYDSVTSTRVQRYEVWHNGAWTAVSGAVYPHGVNENKRNLIHTEVVFDLENNCYDGLRIDGFGFGSLAATPDTSLTAYTPTVETLPTFEGGFNAMFGIRNSNVQSSTHAWANLAYQRTVVVK